MADAAELIPGERREAVLRRWPIHCLCNKIPRQEEICHLNEEQHKLLRPRLDGFICLMSVDVTG